MGLSYDASKKKAVQIISILAVITIVEVLIALAGKGYVIPGVHLPIWLLGLIMIAFSLLKAYLIVYEFMHMKYEVPGLVKSVLLPMFLLVWGVVAFLYEGSDWNNRRTLIEDKNKEVRYEQNSETGSLYYIEEDIF